MHILPVSNISNYYKNVSFKNKKIDYEKGKTDFDNINREFDDAKTEYKRTDFSVFDYESLNKQSEITNRLENISRRFEILDNFLSEGSSIRSNAPEIIERFLDAQNRLDVNCGFNKIVGHDKIKEKLNEKFSINTILRSEVCDNVSVPNSVLFFGPTGCGKSYFATALAEQSITRPVIIEANDDQSETEILSEILRLAEDSKKHFEKTGQRSMIIYNEADEVLYPDSPIEQEFMDFVKDCSDKYKCTMFLTSNYPLDISEKILSPEVTPLKIPVPNPDNNMIAKYLKRKVHAINKEVNIDNIMQPLTKNTAKHYSFSNINKIIEQALKLDPELNEKTLLYIIEKNQNSSRGISNESLKNFNDAIDKLC